MGHTTLIGGCRSIERKVQIFKKLQDWAAVRLPACSNQEEHGVLFSVCNGGIEAWQRRVCSSLKRDVCTMLKEPLDKPFPNGLA